MPRFKELLAEKNILYSLYAVALAAHLVFFYALLHLYGPCSFFLSNDCTLNGNDTQHYVVIAENLMHGHGYSRFLDGPYEADALRTPLLPFYFAPFALIGGYSEIWFAMLLLNILLASAPIFIYKLGRFFLPHAHAAAAGLFMALEPLYLYRSQIAEPDALLVLLLAAAMYFLMRSWKAGAMRDAVVCGALLGLAILAKPTAQYLAVIVLLAEIAFLFFFSKKQTTERYKHAGAMFLIIFAVISPWLLRNYLLFGVPALSSIQGYNLYTYYTADIPLPTESIPETLQKGSREPSRYLPYQSYFTSLALARIKAHPEDYLKEQTIGGLRNLFVTDISAVYYYGHNRLLPFAYNPESKINVHELVAAGDLQGLFRAAGGIIPKLAWAGVLFAVYLLAFWGWLGAWKRDRLTFLFITLSFILYAFLIASSGPYVDAKYRLPALAYVVMAALYATDSLKIDRSALRMLRK